MSMKRRSFVKSGVVAASGLLFVDSVLGAVNPIIGSLKSGRALSADPLFEGFQSPPVNARLFVRWWWNGNRLSSAEILRELDVMKAAGIGGVEINPIAMAGDADPGSYKALTMFDDEWLGMLQTALTGAKERGMVCDMIVGSGWPFGGEFLKKDEQTQLVTIGTFDLEGNSSYDYSLKELLEPVDPPIHSRNNQVYKEILMIRLMPKTSEAFIPGSDLMLNLKDDSLRFTTPPGQHVLYYVVKLTGFMAVINGAPGAAGPVLNHYSKVATEAYLNRISDLITARIGDMGQYIRAMFCDSMELEGANWVDDLPDEFEKRRGYDIRPYLPFVLKKTGHMGNPLNEAYGTLFSERVTEEIRRVGLDYYHTRIELFKERFIDTFNDWCHRHHVKSRMQAYGRGMHPLEASMEIDIPESETWLSKDVGREYPDMGLAGRAPRMCNKYVSSGAALAGKKVVSCEEITNTSMAFMATLESIKVAGDQSNISGVNHSILHGFNYSPPDIAFPGWIRYGTFFNERNTWWPYFRRWADYKARISWLLQNVTPMAHIAILQPLMDLWLKHGPQRDPFPQYSYPAYQDNLWEAVHQNGDGCDYVSERIINQSVFKDGRMLFGNRSYDALLLPEIETLDLKTTQSLALFVAQGGTLVFIEKRPVKSPVFRDGPRQDQMVRSLVDELLKQERVHVYPAPTGDVIRWYGEMQEKLQLRPYVKFDHAHKFLSQSSYERDGRRFFLVANTSLSEHISVEAEFAHAEGMYPWLWDPENGKKYRYPVMAGANRIRLELPRASSAIIVLDPEKKGEWYEPQPVFENGRVVKGSWQLTLRHMNGSEQRFDFDELVDLTQHESTKHFAGVALYEHKLMLDPERDAMLDLGDVQGVAEVMLNGKSLGVRWYGSQLYDLKGAAKKGENLLTVKVTTIVGNYMKSLTENRTAMAWTRHQDYFPMGLIGPVRLIDL